MSKRSRASTEETGSGRDTKRARKRQASRASQLLREAIAAAEDDLVWLEECCVHLESAQFSHTIVGDLDGRWDEMLRDFEHRKEHVSARLARLRADLAAM